MLGSCCFGFALLLCLCPPHGIATTGKFKQKFYWKTMLFDWPNSTAEETAIRTGQYIPDNNLLFGMGRWRNKIFLTVPRYNYGIAATLSYIDANSNEDSPKLRPYPSWEANELPLELFQQEEAPKSNTGSCSNSNKPFELKDDSKLVSAMRLQVDACDRLWIIDNGLLEIFSYRRQLVPSAIVIFDLKTDKMVRRFKIPRIQVKDDSELVNIIVEADASNCDDAYAYLPDYGTSSLIVYSYSQNHSYLVNHNYFHMDPFQGDYHEGGVRFQWYSGLIGMAVGPTKSDSTRDIFFHPLSTYREYKVSNMVLHNETYVTSLDAFDDFKYLGERGIDGQSTVELYDKNTNVLFYTLINRDGVGCWNLDQPYNAETNGLVEVNSKVLPYPNDLQLDDDGNLWVLSDKLPTAVYSGIVPNNVKYVIAVGNIRELIKGTPCEL